MVSPRSGSVTATASATARSAHARLAEFSMERATLSASSVSHRRRSGAVRAAARIISTRSSILEFFSSRAKTVCIALSRSSLLPSWLEDAASGVPTLTKPWDLLSCAIAVFNSATSGPMLRLDGSSINACLAARTRRLTGSFSSEGISARSTKMGMIRIPRLIAASISSRTQSSGSSSRSLVLLCLPDQCGPITASSTKHELTASSIFAAKSSPSRIESTSWNTTPGPNCLASRSASHRAGQLASSRR